MEAEFLSKLQVLKAEASRASLQGRAGAGASMEEEDAPGLQKKWSNPQFFGEEAARERVEAHEAAQTTAGRPGLAADLQHRPDAQV